MKLLLFSNSLSNTRFEKDLKKLSKLNAHVDNEPHSKELSKYLKEIF